MLFVEIGNHIELLFLHSLFFSSPNDVFSLFNYDVTRFKKYAS